MNRDVRKLAWFIWRNYPPAKDWGRDLLRRWVEWASSHAFTAVFVDAEEKIVAVGIARPVMKEYDGYDYWEFDNEGAVIFVDLVIAPTRRLFQGLGILMRKRFGERPSIAFRRLHGSRRVHVYPFKTIMGRIKGKEFAYGN